MKRIHNDTVQHEQSRSIRRPFVFGFFFALGALAAVLVCLAGLSLLSHDISARDITRACKSHRGVERIQEATFSVRIDAKALITCKDGVVVAIK